MGAGVHRRLICVGEKGGSDVGKTKRGKGSKWMVVVDGQGIPLGIHVTSASPSEVTLVEPTLNTIRVPRRGPGRPRQNPNRLIGDRGYDSDPMRERLGRRGITVIVPYRKNNILGAIAEFERARIAERVKAGLRRARAQGKRLGRPRKVPATIIVPGGTVREAALVWGVSKTTAARWIAAGHEQKLPRASPGS